jgi:CRISPR-associated protein Csx3
MQASGCILNWDVAYEDDYTVALFTITRDDGILEHQLLSQVDLPAETTDRRHLGVIISGRGPIWLYAYLTHLAHSFAWLGIYEPRHQGAVVVERHVDAAPAIGEIVPCELPTYKGGSSRRETSKEGEGRAK